MTQIKAPPARMSDGFKGRKDGDGEVLPRIATITDVARVAGVSIKTVSRVMNGEKNVRKETSDKVDNAVNLLKYRPNLLARSLAGSRSFLIGLLHDNPVPSYIYDLQRGAIRRCRESKYHVLSEPQDRLDPNLERSITDLLSTIRLDGVILTPPLCDMNIVLQAIEAMGVPYVRIAPSRNLGQSAAVSIDDSEAAKQMTDYLLGLGHRDIAFIHGHPEHGASHLRYEGFLKAMRAHGLEPRQEWMKPGLFTFDSGKAAAASLLGGGSNRPTAIFACNDEMAFGVMAFAQEKGIKVPDQVSVVGFDDNPGALLIWPHLTTIHQPIDELAYAAADLLVQRAFDNSDPAEFKHQRLELPLRPPIVRGSAKAV